MVGCHYFLPGLQSPSQPESITALWPVPNYTAWWQEAHVCEQLARSRYLSAEWMGIKLAASRSLDRSPKHYATEPHIVMCLFMWCEYKFSANPVPALAGFQFLNLARSVSSRIWNIGILYITTRNQWRIQYCTLTQNCGFWTQNKKNVHGHWGPVSGFPMAMNIVLVLGVVVITFLMY